MTAGSLGLRASKISVTRGRPPVMSCVPPVARGWRASSWPACDLLAFLHLDTGLGRQVVEVEDLALGVLDDDLRVLLALVLDDDQPLDAWRRVLALAFGLDADGFAFLDVLEPDDAGHLGQDRHAVRVPLDQDRCRP